MRPLPLWLWFSAAFQVQLGLVVAISVVSAVVLGGGFFGMLTTTFGAIVAMALGLAAPVVASLAWGATRPQVDRVVVGFGLAGALLCIPGVAQRLRDGLGDVVDAAPGAVFDGWVDRPAGVVDPARVTRHVVHRRFTGSGSEREDWVAPLVAGGRVVGWVCADSAEEAAEPTGGWLTVAPDYGCADAVADVAGPGEPEGPVLLPMSATASTFWHAVLPAVLGGVAEALTLVGLVEAVRQARRNGG